jgi:hypothetical protein
VNLHVGEFVSPSTIFSDPSRRGTPASGLPSLNEATYGQSLELLDLKNSCFQVQ